MSTTDDDHNRLTRYIFTYTGQRVEEEGGAGAPTLTDISVQLGRIPRFVGATAVWWPVLLHSFVVRDLVTMWGAGPDAQLEALFHDAHEALTGDVPSPFKPPALSALQRDLDRRMRPALRVPDPSDEVVQLVKRADTTALLAEASWLTVESKRWVRDAGGADSDAVAIVQEVLHRYPGYADTLEATGEAVQDYIMLFESLRETVNG